MVVLHKRRKFKLLVPTAVFSVVRVVAPVWVIKGLLSCQACNSRASAIMIVRAQGIRL